MTNGPRLKPEAPMHSAVPSQLAGHRVSGSPPAPMTCGSIVSRAIKPVVESRTQQSEPSAYLH
jgi:hypothetical protein